jgi:ferredoxin
MRLVVDEALCVGHGLCVELAPHWFEMDEHGIAHVLIDEVPEDELIEAKAAVLCCPSEAIFLRP